LMELTRRKKAAGPQPPPIRSQFIEWNRNTELYAFNQRLTERFDQKLLDQALTTRPFVIAEEMKYQDLEVTPQVDIKDNRELIEEGRGLTTKIIIKYLGIALPKVPTECIQALCDYLMSEVILADASLSIGVKTLVQTTENPVEDSTMADAFLALVAALAKSADEKQACNFVRDFLLVKLAEKDIPEIWNPPEPLDILTDILLRENRGAAEPRLIGESGVTTLIPCYRVAIYSDKQFLGWGFGDSTEEATDIAARDALYRMFEIVESSKPIRFNIQVDLSTVQFHNLPLSQWQKNKLSNKQLT